ncbi:glycosyltransferase family 39 protein [Sulfitobacter sp. LCG007]
MTRGISWPAVIVAYFTFHTVYRTALGGALGLDEAEMFLVAQEYRWGYGPQLPLYAWLQHSLFLLTGASLFGMALLKNALLCGIVLGLYGILRTRVEPWRAGLGAASLILLPQIGWESQRSLTHSVLVSFCAVVSLAVLWWIARRPSTPGFLCLGLALGAGGLAKYNFVLMPAAAIMAMLTMPGLRGRIADPRLMLSLAIAVAIVAWPYLWIYANPDIAFATATKLRVQEHLDPIERILRGLLAVGSGLRNFLILPAVVGVLLWAFCRTGASAPAGDLERLMRRLILCGLGLLYLGIVLAGVTNFRERWMQPLLIFAAPVLVLWLLPRITGTGHRRLAQVYAALAALFVVGLPVHFYEGDADVAAPFATLVPEIESRLPTPDTAIIAHQWLAGNILYVDPDLDLINEAYPKVRPDPSGDYVLVWKGPELEEGLRRLSDHFPDRPEWSLQEHEVLRAPFRFDQDETFTLSIARIVPSGG